MATSGTISATTFNTRKVIDTAFRRCGIVAQKITAEMQNYARDALYLLLSELANSKPPSWCIEKILLPMYENQPIVTLPAGTVGVLNLLYRTQTEVTGTVTTGASTYTVQFAQATQVATVGINWGIASTALTFAVSTNGVTWTTAGTDSYTAASGETVWSDISQPMPFLYFRITSVGTLTYNDIVLANNPNEIPLGVLNRDQYANQSNKIFPGRPNSYWFQRDLPMPVLNLWPAPNEAAEVAVLVCWRHRHVMDVGTLAQSIEVPQRWLEAVTAQLAVQVGRETPEADPARMQINENWAPLAMQKARDGDNDGSPSFYQPMIMYYTR